MILPVGHDDPRELAAYGYAEASRILDMPASTVRAWKVGTSYSHRGETHRFREPIPSGRDGGISYFDLVELYVLRTLRTLHNFSLKRVRIALAIAQTHYGIERLLLHESFRYDAGGLFLIAYSQLVGLGPDWQQSLIREVLEPFLQRVDYGDDKLATVFYPLVRGRDAASSPKIVVINPLVSFGRPVVRKFGIRTEAIVSRLHAGEAPEHVMEDYGLTQEEFDEARRFEQVA